MRLEWCGKTKPDRISVHVHACQCVEGHQGEHRCNCGHKWEDAPEADGQRPSDGNHAWLRMDIE